MHYGPCRPYRGYPFRDAPLQPIPTPPVDSLEHLSATLRSGTAPPHMSKAVRAARLLSFTLGSFTAIPFSYTSLNSHRVRANPVSSDAANPLHALPVPCGLLLFVPSHYSQSFPVRSQPCRAFPTPRQPFLSPGRLCGAILCLPVGSHAAVPYRSLPLRSEPFP